MLPLLLLVFTPAYGSLSDATGLVNRFDIETSGHFFEVSVTANFDVSEVEFDKDQKQLTFHLISGLENNLGELIIPQNLLSGNFTFFLNNQEHYPKVNTNEKIAFITLNFTGSGNNKLEVIGTNYLEGFNESIESNGMEVTFSEEDSNKNGGGCLIATAAFDSELSTQVQHLRELRDNKLLQSKLGSDFILFFNNVYYSFSPQIADLERENQFFKNVVKVSITPLIYSLSLLNYVDLQSDLEIIGYVSSILLLNLGMYFGIPAITIWRINKR